MPAVASCSWLHLKGVTAMNKREMLIELVAAFVIAAICTLTIYSLAYAQEVQTSRGLICDTPEQVVRVIKADDFQATIVAVNAEKALSCAIMPVAFIMHGTKSEQVHIGANTWQIEQILVVGANVGNGFQPIQPMLQWAAFLVDERGA
jgi:hypothetical protein